MKILKKLFNVKRDSNESNNNASLELDKTPVSDVENEDVNREINTFEKLLEVCGDAGWWQFNVSFLASFAGFIIALQSLSYIFIGAIPKHWCTTPQIPNEIYSLQQLKNLTLPLNQKGTDFSECFQFVRSRNNSIEQWTQESLISSIDRNLIEECQSITFDHSTFTSTIATDFELVCGNTGWSSLYQSIYVFGVFIGCPLFGFISDKLGAKTTIQIATLIFAVSAPTIAVFPNFTTMMIARFVLGLATPGVYNPSFVLAVEIVGTEWRGVAGNLICIPFAFGYMSLAGMAYFLREWRLLQLGISATIVPQILISCLLPERPRWLLRKGRVEEAIKILRDGANTNGRVLPSKFNEWAYNIAQVESNENVSEEKMSIVQKIQDLTKDHVELFRAENFWLFILYFCWMSTSMTYYGIALNSPNLSTDRYVYVLLSGLLEIPSYFMVPPLIAYFGRCATFSGCTLFCSFSLLGSLLLSEESIYIVVLALLGKLLVGGAYALIYLYSTEIIPTPMRNFGLGSASMFARIGSALSPFVVDIFGRDHKFVPPILFGIVSLIAGLLALFLPETAHRRLPDTFEDNDDKQEISKDKIHLEI